MGDEDKSKEEQNRSEIWRRIIDLLAEQSSIAVTSPSQYVVATWIRALKRRPALTGIITLLLFGALVTTAVVIDAQQKEKREQERSQNITLHNQLEELDRTEKSIEELLVFVTDQRKRVSESEALVETLKSEKAQLEPLVNADKATVDAFFSVQEQRNRRSVWAERGIGFGFGVVASLLATAIWTICAALLRRKRNSEQPVTVVERQDSEGEKVKPVL